LGAYSMEVESEKCALAASRGLINKKKMTIDDHGDKRGYLKILARKQGGERGRT